MSSYSGLEGYCVGKVWWLIGRVYYVLQGTIPYVVKNLSLAVLKMGKSLPETCRDDLGNQ